MKQALFTIFHFLWAVWGFSAFISIVAILTPIYALLLLFGGNKMALRCIWFNAHYVSPFLIRLMLIRLHIHGADLVKREATYIYVSNHLSQIDILANASAVPHPIKFLAKMEVKYIPFFGFMVKMLAIVVDRQNKDSREQSFERMLVALKQGESLFLYPEGTRNRTGQPLKEFKDGAFRAAILAQVPIVVQTLVNPRELNNPDGIHLQPGRLDLYFSAPIDTRGMSLEDVPRLKRQVIDEMMRHLVR